MSNLGFTWGFLLVQAVNLVILLAWPVLSLLALFSLRGRRLAQTAQVMWVLIVLVVPLLGPLALWIVRPGEALAEQPPASGLTNKTAP